MKAAVVRNRIGRHLLLGVARFALRHSIRLRELVELLKQVLVECAIDELRTSGSPVTAARISVMTGVHRKDVDRLVNQEIDGEPSESSLISRVIGQWRGDPAFSNKLGQPRVLSYEGSESDFAKLVRSVTTELNPSLVLTELERVGAVSKQTLGLKLLTSVYVPKPDELNFYTMLAEDAQDLVLSVDRNIRGASDVKNLHIKTEYDGIPDSLVREASEWILREGTLMHEKFATYLSSKDKDMNPSLRKLVGRNRVAITSFSLSAQATAG